MDPGVPYCGIEHCVEEVKRRGGVRRCLEPDVKSLMGTGRVHGQGS